DHKCGNQHDTQQRQLIRQCQDRHRRPASEPAGTLAIARMCSIASIASAPVTTRDGWNDPSGAAVMTPAATAVEAAGYARCPAPISVKRPRALVHALAWAGATSATFARRRVIAWAKSTRRTIVRGWNV